MPTVNTCTPAVSSQRCVVDIIACLVSFITYICKLLYYNIVYNRPFHFCEFLMKCLLTTKSYMHLLKFIPAAFYKLMCSRMYRAVYTLYFHMQWHSMVTLLVFDIKITIIYIIS